MKLVFLKAGKYEVQEESGDTVFTIQQWTKVDDVRFPRFYRSYWRVGGYKTRPQTITDDDFTSLRRAVKSLRIQKWSNYPGPFKILATLNQ